MTEEINLGRLVAEIALENEDLKNNAEEAVEAIKEIENIAEQVNPKVNVTVNTTGTDTAQNEIDSIPSDPISVGVSVTAINNIQKLKSLYRQACMYNIHKINH